MLDFTITDPWVPNSRKNVKDEWWKTFVTRREDVVGLDSSIIHNPATWQSSGTNNKTRVLVSWCCNDTCSHSLTHSLFTGHLDGFSDPMVDCKETKLRFRADQLFYSPVVIGGNTLGYVCVHEADDDTMVKEAKKQAKKVVKGVEGASSQDVEPFFFQELLQATEEEMTMIPSPASGAPTLTAPRDFNLMFETSVGAATDASSIAYLRPETAQGIFLNFKNAQATSRLKIPFGIAQIGKAFRNEITPRNFIFRSREFEQMEVEYFIPPGDDVWGAFHKQWMEDSKDFL